MKKQIIAFALGALTLLGASAQNTSKLTATKANEKTTCAVGNKAE